MKARGEFNVFFADTSKMVEVFSLVRTRIVDGAVVV
jgi:hypothetical protein